MVIQDMEAAQAAVLGSLLISPELTGEALTRIRPEDFVSPRHRMTFEAIRDVFQAGGPVDLIPVLARLGAQDSQEWRGYLLSLMEQTPTAANIWVYAEQLKRDARLYRLRRLGERLAEARSLEDAEALVAQAQEQLVDKPGVRCVTMEQALLDFYGRHQTKKEYLTWGLDKLNDRLYVEEGDLVVLGGYSSAGKTLLAIQFAWHLAGRCGKKVGFYSLETGTKKLEDRLIAYAMRLDFAKIKRSELDEADYEALAIASGRLTEPRLEWVEASGMTVGDIRAHALSRTYQVIFIDYLQLAQPPAGWRGTDYERVSAISIALHQLSQSTGITVVALSQLSRADKTGNDTKAPTMASFRGSGQIEQDADVAMLLYKEEDLPNSRRVLHVAKNKEGETGKIYLAFDGQHQRLYESAVDAPAPKKRPEPPLNQVRFEDLTRQPPDPEDPFGPKTT